MIAVRATQTLKATRTPRVRETPEVASAARRMIRAVAKRAIEHVDIDALTELVALREVLDQAIVDAVAGLRSGSNPYSWADVGRVTGMTRQAAQEKYSPRLPGQPKRVRADRSKPVVQPTPIRRTDAG